MLGTGLLKLEFLWGRFGKLVIMLVCPFRVARKVDFLSFFIVRGPLLSCRYSHSRVNHSERGGGPSRFLFPRWLLSVGRLCIPSATQLQESFGYGRAWSCLKLVECLSLAGYLRQYSTMRTVIQRSICFSLPRRFREMIEDGGCLANAPRPTS